MGNRFSSAEQLAKAFDKSITYLGSQLSSCRQYNLLELKKGEGYKPTEFFYKVTRGRTEKDKLDALIYCLKSPSIYYDFIEKYDGQELPSDLPSIFYWDYGITELAKDAAAKTFIENLNFVGVIIEGKLIISKTNADHDEPSPGIGQQVNSTPPPQQNKPQVGNNIIPNLLPVGYKRSDIKITNGRFVSLEFPADLSNDDIDKIRKILDTWKDD